MTPLFGAIVSLWTVLGVGVGALGVLLLPVVAIIVGVLLWRRTKGQQPGTVVTVPGLNKQVDLGIFSGLVGAVQSGDQQKMLREVQLLALRAGDAGGIEALLEKFLYDQLEKKLAGHQRTDALTDLAELLGVNERQLLDLVEGKSPAPLAATVAKAVATPVIAILLCLTTAGDAWAVDSFPLTGPQRFYASEVDPVIDPPAFRSRMTGTLSPQAGDCNVPDSGPIIFIYYFYAGSCRDCGPANEYCRTLNARGYNVISTNTDTRDGQERARIFSVTSVPTFIVSKDGQDMLRTNSAPAVYSYLRGQPVPVAAAAASTAFPQSRGRSLAPVRRLFGRW